MKDQIGDRLWMMVIAHTVYTVEEVGRASQDATKYVAKNSDGGVIAETADLDEARRACGADLASRDHMWSVV